MKRLWLFLLLGLLLALPVAASVLFPPSVRLDDRDLALAGTGRITWLWFDVCDGALYLPAGTAPADWRRDIPKKLILVYRTGISAEDFVASAESALSRNLRPEEWQALAPRIAAFHSLYRPVKAGDSYALIYVPATGTRLLLNGQPLGAVEGADFAEAYLRIWLGDDPVSTDFRDALLQG